MRQSTTLSQPNCLHATRPNSKPRRLLGCRPFLKRSADVVVFAKHIPQSNYSERMIEGAPERPSPQNGPASPAGAKEVAIDPDQGQNAALRRSHGKSLDKASALIAGIDLFRGYEVPRLGSSQISPKATKTKISTTNAEPRAAIVKEASASDRCTATSDLSSPMRNSLM